MTFWEVIDIALWTALSEMEAQANSRRAKGTVSMVELYTY